MGHGWSRINPQSAHCRTANVEDPVSKTLSEPVKSFETDSPEHAGQASGSRLIVLACLGFDAGGDAIAKDTEPVARLTGPVDGFLNRWRSPAPLERCVGWRLGKVRASKAQVVLQLIESEAELREAGSDLQDNLLARLLRQERQSPPHPARTAAMPSRDRGQPLCPRQLNGGRRGVVPAFAVQRAPV